MAENDRYTFCEVCNMELGSVEAKNEHLLDKKHGLALHRANVNDAKEKCGIFVRGFPLNTKPTELMQFLSTYGEIVDCYVGDNNRFAIIQFNNPETVNTLLKTKLEFSGNTLFVNRRIVRKRKDPPEPIQPVENFEEINESLKTISSFEEQVVVLCHQLQPNISDMIHKYEKLCKDLQLILYEIFPDCVVHPFGSTVTGLEFSSSDVDIYVEVFSVKIPTRLDHNKATTYVCKSKTLIEKYPNIFSHVYSIPRAKTPIVKCVHKLTKIHCDINFKNMLGVRNTDLIKYYLSLDKKLKSVIMMIKYWAKVHELSGSSGKFSNYSLIMLVIFYLQANKFSMPSVAALQRSVNFVTIHEGWNAGFAIIPEVMNDFVKNCTTAEILHGFFAYYKSFDYTLNIISPYLGCSILKTDFITPECLPKEFDLYKRNISQQHPLKVETPICIQDPFEHNHNLVSSVPVRVLEEFVRLCTIAVENFQNQIIDNTILPNLFTRDTETLTSKNMFNKNSCTFSLAMGSSCLLYLNHKTTDNSNDLLDPDEKTVKMRSAWYYIANEFIITFLMKTMRFCVTMKPSDNKAQRLNDQDDVHDTNVVDSVSFHCSGNYNLWETRKSILKDLTVDSSLGFLDKQIYLTDYICNLYKKLISTDAIIEFEINVLAKVNPVEMCIGINNIKSKRYCFESFCAFALKNLPRWFEKHCIELDKTFSKSR